jgi:isoleucyl-tRNA synthetase
LGWSDELNDLIAREVLALEFELNTVSSVNLRPEPDPGLDMQSGRVRREGDMLSGSIGRGYPVQMERVAEA